MSSLSASIHELKTDFQAHMAAWKKVIYDENSLSEEEKQLLEGRIDPIYREMQIVKPREINKPVL